MVKMLEHLPFVERLRELASSALEKTGFWEKWQKLPNSY